jgi:hypothetical protein
MDPVDLLPPAPGQDMPRTRSGRALTYAELAQLTGQDGAWSQPQRRLRQHVETTCSRLQGRLDALARAVTEAVAKVRTSPKLAPNVALLALNLYAAYRQDERLTVALPMGAPWYSGAAPRNPILTYRIMVEQAWAGMVALEFAELLRKGSPWGGSYSTVRATPALVAFLEADGGPPPHHTLRLVQNHDPIILKASKPDKARAKAQDNDAAEDDDDAAEGNGQPITFTDTPETERMRAAVVRINAVNTPDRIRLSPLTEDEGFALWMALRGSKKARKEPPPSPDALDAWFAQTALHRVFNRGSFDLGGRFYGASWQLMSGEWRRRILIDGEAVMELDFGSLHPRMTHHLLERREAPEDCYAGIPVPRAIAKRAVSALLNMEGGTSRAPRWFRVDEVEMRWASLVVRAGDALPGIAHHFGTGAGLRLQRIDSEIAEAIMLHFADRDVPCLGVHDSFIVGQQHAAELEAVMRRAYRDRIGFEPFIPAA